MPKSLLAVVRSTFCERFQIADLYAAPAKNDDRQSRIAGQKEVQERKEPRTDVDAETSLAQVRDVHEVEHALRLRLGPVLPRAIWQCRTTSGGLPARERPPRAELLDLARDRVPLLAATPVDRVAFLPVRVDFLVTQLLPRAVHARVVRLEEEEFGGRTRGALVRLELCAPALDEVVGRALLVIEEARAALLGARERDQVAARARVRNVELLGVEADDGRRVVDRVEPLLHAGPRRARNVLENDDLWARLLNPAVHPEEGAGCARQAHRQWTPHDSAWEE